MDTHFATELAKKEQELVDAKRKLSLYEKRFGNVDDEKYCEIEQELADLRKQHQQLIGLVEEYDKAFSSQAYGSLKEYRRTITIKLDEILAFINRAKEE